MTDRHAYEPAPTVTELGGTDPWLALLMYEDGEIGVRHSCRTIEDDLIIPAPKLQLGHGHTVTVADPITVTPSILCPDCGLHGFVTAGVWRPA